MSSSLEKVYFVLRMRVEYLESVEKCVLKRESIENSSKICKSVLNAEKL